MECLPASLAGRQDYFPTEIDRIVTFRHWLREHNGDRELYAGWKRTVTEREWKCAQNYADAKTAVVEEILARALAKGR